MPDTFIAADGQPRCDWCAASAQLQDYHDREWGFPVADDVRLFEKISLEGFQAGLSWRTILAKREAFRAAFCGFDFRQVAQFGEADVERLLGDRGIVRHRGKIEAVIHNARCACRLVEEEGSLARFIWRFAPSPPKTLPARVAGEKQAAQVIQAAEGIPDQGSGFPPQSPPQSRTTSPESVQLSKALKARGWKFVGPTTMFAFMQSMGMINDHLDGCVTRARVDAALARFRRP